MIGDESGDSGYSDSHHYAPKAKPEERSISISPFLVLVEYPNEEEKTSQENKRQAQ